MKRKILSIIALVVLLISTIVPATVMANDVTVLAGVYTNTLNLENKDSSWQVKADAIGGVLGYNASGSEFVYGVHAEGLPDVQYALIYYADTEDRFNEWGGNHPGAVIGFGTPVGGVLDMSGSAELDMDLPCPPDANAYFYDYHASDGYDHATGAKIWLIPASLLTDGTSLPITSWLPDDTWLFETDLITYDDTDVVSDVVAITVAPSSINFGSILTPGQTGNGGNVTVTNSGTVPCNVTAAAPSSGVFQYIQLNGAPVSSYAVSGLTVGASDVATATLPVPAGYTPTGQESGTITFTAVSALP